jgi:hypothetical protein
MSTGRGRQQGGLAGYGQRRGVLIGMDAGAPASGATLTYFGGLVCVGDGKGGSVEKRIADGTKVVTTSKDTYAYVTSAGVLSYIEKTTGDPKPTPSDIGADSEYLWGIVCGAADISAVYDLRRWVEANVERIDLRAGFLATDVGSIVVRKPYPFRILSIDGVVQHAMGATDAGTITASKVDQDATATAITNGALSFAASAAALVRHTVIPTAYNYIGIGEYVKFVTAKTTAGGVVQFGVNIERY